MIEKKSVGPQERYSQKAKEVNKTHISELMEATVYSAEKVPEYMMTLIPSELREREVKTRVDLIKKNNLSYDQLVEILAETQLLLDQNHFAYQSMAHLANTHAAHIERKRNLDLEKLKIGGFSKAESYNKHKYIFNTVYSDLKEKIGTRPRLKIILNELERVWPEPPPPMTAWSSDTLKIWFKIRNQEEKENEK